MGMSRNSTPNLEVRMRKAECGVKSTTSGNNPRSLVMSGYLREVYKSLFRLRTRLSRHLGYRLRSGLGDVANV